MTRKNKHLPRTWLFRATIPAIAGMLLFTGLLTMSGHARAQDNTAGFFSASYLFEMCMSDENGKEIVKNGHTACQSYIAGVIDYHKLMRSLGTQPLIDFCVPNTEPMPKLQEVVWYYLATNKQHGPFIAAPAVTLALYDQYPCKKPAAKKKRR